MLSKIRDPLGLAPLGLAVAAAVEFTLAVELIPAVELIRAVKMMIAMNKISTALTVVLCCVVLLSRLFAIYAIKIDMRTLLFCKKNGEISHSVARMSFTLIAVALLRWSTAKAEPPPIMGVAQPAPFINSLGMKFATIQPGEFKMGSPATEEGRHKDELQHKVRLTETFHIGIYPVTRSQFATFVHDTNYQTDAESCGYALSWFDDEEEKKIVGASWRHPGFDQVDDDPVVTISYRDAMSFCHWLSRKEAKTYRLPTEAEWEYCCRAGTEGAYFAGETEIQLSKTGWYSSNSGRRTHPVGQKAANAWGLYDTHGNVWQWCGDNIGAYDGDVVDPVGPIGDFELKSARVLRGGAWSEEKFACRAAARTHAKPGTVVTCYGFRVCLSEDPVAAMVAPPSELEPPLQNSIGMKLVLIKPGQFTMGSPVNEPGRRDDETQHKVIITKAFRIGMHPVTRGQFAAFAHATGYRTSAESQGFAMDCFGPVGEKMPGASWRRPGFLQTDDDPVVDVVWKDAIVFCRWLGQKEGKTYRLPTEAEWEYACRAGTKTVYYTGTTGQAFGVAGWYMRNSGWRTHPVGRKTPNAWGLYDMLGSVWQWCGDFDGPFSESAAIDPVGPIGDDSNDSRVMRGGSYINELSACRCATRVSNKADVSAENSTGFRVCLAVEEDKASNAALSNVPHQPAVNSIGMKFTMIDPGEFKMGSPATEACRHDDETQHKVSLTKAFEIGIYPVTRGQFATFLHDSGWWTDAERNGKAVGLTWEKFDFVADASWRKPGFDQADDEPAVDVTWLDARAFCDWLSKKEGKTYRLPTEAEWEYACRAGTNTVYYGGDGGEILANSGWYQRNSGWRTHSVGYKLPNKWGLYDMLGNVWQWCEDSYGPYTGGSDVDPHGPVVGDNNLDRVLRGGSFFNELCDCRCASRRKMQLNTPASFAGFRVVRSVK